MEAVAVDIDGKVVAELGLQADCIELGGAPHADVVLPELDQTMRGFLVQPIHAGVFVYSLSDVGSAMRATTLCIDKRQVLDGRVGITRIRSEKSQVGARLQTDRINVDPQHRSLSLVLGAGPEARRVLIKRKPLSIGSAPDNDLVLMDRTISRYHCRIETSAIGSVVRDLHSRNGTWLNGARVRHAGLRPGAMIRLGRTNLRIISRDTTPNGSSDCLIAESPAMSTVLADVENFAQLPWPVLILGQSGTGKEKIAQALHLRGPRADKPFVALNAGGLPATLVESELFGHEKGAFTGAIAQHRGVFEQADTGTIFLDEVGELPLALQARLLRVLETWSIRRVGSESDQSVDVRLICATHQDLHKMVSTGRFRQDLYYRINRLLIEVPPLRQRPEDIEALCGYFLQEIAGDVGIKHISDDALGRLVAYPWPGNARELRNVLCTAAALCGGTELGRTDIDLALLRLAEPGMSTPAIETVHEVVQRYRGNLAAAARALGVPRSTLRDRLGRGKRPS